MQSGVTRSKQEKGQKRANDEVIEEPRAQKEEPREQSDPVPAATESKKKEQKQRLVSYSSQESGSSHDENGSR